MKPSTAPRWSLTKALKKPTNRDYWLQWIAGKPAP